MTRDLQARSALRLIAVRRPPVKAGECRLDPSVAVIPLAGLKHERSHSDLYLQNIRINQEYQWYVGLLNPVVQPTLMQQVVYLRQDKTTNHVELSKFGYGRERNRSSLRLNRILSPFASKS